MPNDWFNHNGRKVGTGIEALLLSARWALVPIYIGMALALIVVAVKFIEKLVAAIWNAPGEQITDLIIGMLALIDLSLVANLVLMVMLAGYANFVAAFHKGGDAYRPQWLHDTDFGSLKLKLVSTIAVIAAVTLLESYMEDNLAYAQVVLHLAMLLGFGVLAVLLAASDRIAATEHPGRVPEPEDGAQVYESGRSGV